MKSLDSSPPGSANFNQAGFYEPTSVLDPHLTSSPAAFSGGSFQGPPPPPPQHSDVWDPVAAWLLSDKDDIEPAALKSHYHYPDDPVSSFFDLPDNAYFPDSAVQAYSHSPPVPSTPPPEAAGFDRGHLDLLIGAAQAAECGDLHTAHVILARLNQYLPTSSGGPLQRAAFHFRDALLSLLPIPDPPAAEPPFSAVELVRRIAAHKAHSDLSPIPQFAGFTANQTLLEALDAAPSLHLIDFDLGLGGQWSSFAQEVAARSRAARRPPPPIRLTAVVPDDSPEAALASENLRDFARGLGVRLSVDFVRVGGLGALALGGIRLSSGRGEATAVVLTPAVFRLLGGAPESDDALLRFVRRASPAITVFIDTEPWGSAMAPQSFRRSYASSLEFYAAVLESLDAAAAVAGAGEEAIRRIERSVLRPRMFASVAACGDRSSTWRDTFLAAGMSPVPFSEFTESQAEWLLRRGPVDGFHVARRDGSMVLSWRGRDLAATSAWKC